MDCKEFLLHDVIGRRDCLDICDEAHLGRSDPNMEKHGHWAIQVGIFLFFFRFPER